MISPLGIEASLRALEELSTGDAAQRIALSSKLEQLEYEAKKAFEQYDAVDARNRLVADELERRWNEKLEEIARTKQRLAGLNGKRYSLSVDEEDANPERWARTFPKSGKAITVLRHSRR